MTVQSSEYCNFAAEAWGPPTRESSRKASKEQAEPFWCLPPRCGDNIHCKNTQWNGGDDEDERDNTNPRPCSNRTTNCEILVRFGNRTFVYDDYPLCVLRKDDEATRSDHHVTFSCCGVGIAQTIVQFVSNATGWSTSNLRVHSYTPPFCTVVTVSRLLGGKGGFGTLLKGQSRQAAGKTTIDFASCRDLQGRRLRTVNDEIAQRLHREWQQKVDSGQATKEDMIRALADTPSGVAGWFLQIPAWAEKGARKVARRQHQKQMAHWKREQHDRQQAELEKRQWQERQATQYVTATQERVSQVTSQLQSAIQQGLLQAGQQASQGRHNKRKLEETGPSDQGTVETLQPADVKRSPGQENDDSDDDEAIVNDDNGKSSPLVTLSGEVLEVLGNPKDHTSPAARLQGNSNFATVGVLLQPQSSNETNLYYEVVVVSGGLVQIGWAAMGNEEKSVRMDSEAGNGVGDVPGSWSYDGSRQIKLHATLQGPDDDDDATSVPYGPQWKAGDVIGSLYRNGSIQYFINGQDANIAFDGIDAAKQQMMPAVSLNSGEVIEIRLDRNDFQYYNATASGATPVGEAVLGQSLLTTDQPKSLAGGDGKVAASSTSQSDTKPPPPATANAGIVDVDTIEHNKVSEAPVSVPLSKSTESAPPDGPIKEPTEPLGPIILDEFDSVETLERLGLDRLKAALMERGLKCGGTRQERAARLLSVKGLSPEDYPKKLLAKK